MDSYKNVLANKFMRDTNYIIIKDTDDLEELERQYELFNTQLTVRQQRLSDDRSIEIWNMTNKEHYEALKHELMGEIDSKYGNDDESDFDSVVYEPEDDEITNYLNMDFDDNYEIPDDENDITTPVKEDTDIPINKDDKPVSLKSIIDFRDTDKDTQADQYEIDTNINIIGSIKGFNYDDIMTNLEKSFTDFNSQSHDHRKKSDDKCREIYGMSNLERYNKIKAHVLTFRREKQVDKITSTDGETLDKELDKHLEFVQQVHNNMIDINEAQEAKFNQHRRFNDTPYFTPTELIDMGVHGNHNFYSPEPDNDGLITNIKVATWFDSYKDMCMDHIFEDYRKEWIDTLDELYSDFDDIKASGDEEKILARKQSILDLGWNPEIPFNRKNRVKAAKRVSKLLDQTVPRDIFINLEDIVEDEIVEENVSSDTHKPVYLIFVKGKTPIISSGIKYFTKSEYSHTAMSFDSKLDNIHSYNISGNGVVRETIAGYKDSDISVLAFFAPNDIVAKMQDKVADFESHKTDYDFTILINKVFKIDRKLTGNSYKQVCSTFVDTVLQSGKVDLSKDVNIPDPGQLYNSAKASSNKIIEVYDGPADKYNENKVNKKMSSLLKRGFIGIDEAVSDMKSHERNDSFYNIDKWESGECNLMWVTGLSGSGKSTISKEICESYGAIYVELDNIQRAKMDNWDTTKCEVLDSYIKSKGGLSGIFPNLNDLETITWKDIVGDEEWLVKEFNDLYDFIFNYAKSHKNKKFVVEGVQIAMCANKSNTVRMSKYPVIIKNNGVFKTEFRREIRTIKYGIEHEKSFFDIMSRVISRNAQWIKGKFYLDDWNELKDFKSYMTESVSILNEVKQFPIEFDKEGNLIIYKSRVGSLSFGDEINDSVQLLESYRNASNIEGMKYELAKLWFINDCIEKKLKKRLTNDQYKELIDTRAICLNVFKLNLDYVMKAEKGFNFSDYYNSTPFSDNSTKITANTLKYGIKAMASMI